MEKILVKKSIKKIVTTKPVAVKREKQKCDYKIKINYNYDDKEPSDIRTTLYDDNSEEHSINFSLENNDTILSGFYFDISSTAISCGVFQLTNISALNRLEDYLKKFDDDKELIVNTLKEFLKQIKKDFKLAYLIASNNTDSKYANSILDEIAVSQTDYIANPNMAQSTKSKIKVWIL